MVLYALLVGAALAVMGITIAITAREYRSLPERVPLHFGFDGRPGNYGPRPAIWLIVLIQVVIFAASSLGEDPMLQKGDVRHALGSAIFRLCVLAFTAQLQFGLISAAKSVDQRLPIRQFYGSIAFLFAAIFVTMRLF